MSATPGLNLADFPGDVLTVEQAAQILNVGRAAAYRAIHTGDLPTIKIGRTVRVPKRALARMLDMESNAANVGEPTAA